MFRQNTIPNEIKLTEGHEEKSIYGYQSNDDALLVSYVDKKKTGKRNIVILTTLIQRINTQNHMCTLSMIISNIGLMWLFLCQPLIQQKSRMVLPKMSQYLYWILLSLM